jgi:hypothetical protein
VVEVMRGPERATGLYLEALVSHPGDTLELARLPAAVVAVLELLPGA